MDIYLIRHGRTQGNLEGRYIGSTDESLCREGRKELMQTRERRKLPFVDYLYSSPMKRCRESAGILFPGMEARLVLGLRECDFGVFENKNYQELAADPAYQRWIDSNGTLPFPGGENQRRFRSRCAEAFADIVSELLELNAAAAAVVAHGGTIMSILERYAEPARPFYDWQIKNGESYHILVDGSAWKRQSRIQVLEHIREPQA